jgi:hypothetical protein
MVVDELAELIHEGRVVMMGPVRQELLSGIKTHAQFELLRERLRAFPDVALDHFDYEEAASCFNQCRAKGIQGSNTDFLICAVAIRRDLPIFTTDVDLKHFGGVLPIRLHEVRE